MFRLGFASALLLAVGLLGSPRAQVGSTPWRARLAAAIADAQAALSSGDHERAVALLTDAVRQSESRDSLATSVLHGKLGEAYERSGDYQRALSSYELGLDLLDRHSSIEGFRRLQAQAKGYHRSSNPSLDVGPPPISLTLAQFLTGDEAGAWKRLTLALLINAANVYLRQLQLEPARTLLDDALERVPKQDDLSPALYLALSRLATQRGDLGAAEKWLQAVDVKQLNSVELAGTSLMLGMIWRQRDDLERAAGFLREAFQGFEAGKDALGQARAVGHLVYMTGQAGQCRRAELWLERMPALAWSDADSEWLANAGIASCLKRAGESRRARHHFALYVSAMQRVGDRLGSDEGKVTFFESHYPMVREYIELLADEAAATGQFESLHETINGVHARALVALRTRTASERLPPGHLPAAYAITGGSHLPLEDLTTVRGIPTLPRHLFTGLTETVLAIPSTQIHPPRSVHARRVAPAHATFVEYLLLSDRTVVIVSSRHIGIRGALVPGGEAAIREKVAEFRRVMQVDSPRGINRIAGNRHAYPVAPGPVVQGGLPSRTSAIARGLYETLLAPVERHLGVAEGSVLVLVPDRALWELPFAALIDNNGQFLGDRFLLTTAASVDTWLEDSTAPRRRNHRDARAWVVGDPALAAEIAACGETFAFTPLAAAREEAQAVKALVQKHGGTADLFLGSQADRFRLEGWHADYTIIHLATHGLSCPDQPLSSFLALSEIPFDGFELDSRSKRVHVRQDRRKPVHLEDPNNILEPHLLSGYSGLLDARAVHSRFVVDADLVTLSACQTGVGGITGEGVLGFTRAFLSAGARSVLVSLWRVDDTATRDLMVRFYQEYLTHGDKARALQHAMKHVRRKYPEPRFWAAFRLVGLPA